MNSKQSRRNNVQFAYFSESYLRFEKDYYTYSKLEVPLTFFTEDILHSMGETQRNYFKLPAYQAVDNRNHYFIFNVSAPDANKEIRLYEYDRHTWSYEDVGRKKS
ncbi:hypothetical protein CL176_07410 [Suicoccus acidiformans]|uniref:Uncharacterized protein n=1 Tax=Suicoccus acidiformans TaxID=2036206 RepID=A0A347WL80_9LACT|nr:DUF5960 family protein [Suicoccus acidiformans]AXY25837.1 hypothetical protein CL176_07410 [Suicoccus acidiformans]